MPAENPTVVDRKVGASCAMQPAFVPSAGPSRTLLKLFGRPSFHAFFSKARAIVLVVAVGASWTACKVDSRGLTPPPGDQATGGAGPAPATGGEGPATGGAPTSSGGAEAPGEGGIGGERNPMGPGGATSEADAGSFAEVDAGSPTDAPAALDAASLDGVSEDAGSVDAVAPLDLDARLVDATSGPSDGPLIDPCQACQNAGGSCDDTRTCIFRCGEDGACASGVKCPFGIPCQISCGTRACAGPLDCSRGASCDITCSGEASCTGGIVCGGATCQLTCTGRGACTRVSLLASENHCRCEAAGTCQGDVTCNGDLCQLTCEGEDACRGRVVANAGDATVTCAGARSCQGKVGCSAATCGVTCMGDASCAAGVCCNAGACSLVGQTGRCF